MGHKRRKRKQRARWQMREIESAPFCAIIKSAFFRDLLINLEMLFDQLPPNVPITDSLDQLLESLKLDGYEISRDGDSIRVRDKDGQLVFDPLSLNTETAIVQAVDRAERVVESVR